MAPRSILLRGAALSLLTWMSLCCTGAPKPRGLVAPPSGTAPAVGVGGATSAQIPAAVSCPKDVAPVTPVVAATSRLISGVITYSNHAPFPGVIVSIPGTQIQVVSAADGSFA